MDALRNNEEQVICPYNPSHYIRKGRMDVHLKKCRNSYRESQVFVICDFNAAHRIPEPELQYHHDSCPDRGTVELHVFSEEKSAPKIVPVLPSVPVPVDDTWDNDDVPSYNPQKYCEENHILRRIDTESAATRRDFRIAERHRHSNLGPTKTGTTLIEPTAPHGSKSSKTGSATNNIQNLPPTPRFNLPNFENPPNEITARITEMMQKVDIIPKAAVIPRNK